MKDTKNPVSDAGRDRGAPRRYCFDYEGKPFKVAHPRISAAEIKVIVGQPADIPLAVVMDDDMQRILGDLEEVELSRGCSVKRVPRFRRGYSDRVLEEFNCFVLARYPNAMLSQNRDLIEIPNYPLPAGLYNSPDTDLAILLTRAYPEAAPDNFYVNVGLRFGDGRPLTAYSEGVIVGTRARGQFSWHLDGTGWTASPRIDEGDNLGTFLLSIQQRLQEDR